MNHSPDDINGKFFIVQKERLTQIILNDTLDAVQYELLLLTIHKETETVCAIRLCLTVKDCNRVTWQTVTVIILSSFSVLLLSTLAIMLILYQQRGIIGKGRCNDDDDDDFGRPRAGPAYQTDLRDNTFINPRRTSSYDFNTLSRNSNSELNRQNVHD